MNDNLTGPLNIESALSVRGLATQAHVETRSQYRLTAVSGEGASNVAWMTELEFAALFTAAGVETNFEQEELEAFAILSGAVILHPFARDLVHSLSSRSSYPALTMGILTPASDLPDDLEIELDDTQGDSAGTPTAS
ncbi:MAG: protein-export chaperone SecB [Nocardioides sp.]